MSQSSRFPRSNPRRNQRTRIADDPCVKLSGRTARPDIFWILSSPMAAAAARPSSMSPGSRSFRCYAECPHAPAKQSAWSSRRTERSFFREGSDRWERRICDSIPSTFWVWCPISCAMT